MNLNAVSTCPSCHTENPAPEDAASVVYCRGCGQQVRQADVGSRSDPRGLTTKYANGADAVPVPAPSLSSSSLKGIAGKQRDPSSSETLAIYKGASSHDMPVTVGPIEGTADPAGIADPSADKFTMLEELNRGGMGIVLRGRDRGIHREVAIKVLRDPGNLMQRARFIKEAQITGQLEHPNIVPVHEFGRDGSGRMFMAMKLVRGRNLAEIIELHREDPQAANREQPLTKMLGIVVQICHAVAFAHARGVIHRDLKPANIMLGDFGEVMVMDWGLAKAAGSASVGGQTIDGSPEAVEVPSTHGASSNKGSRPSSSSGSGLDVTIEGAVIGTPAYMPPEQASGRVSQMDARSDVYSIGAILYEILTLRQPIEGASINEILHHAADGLIVDPLARAPERKIPVDLAAIAMKALSHDPRGRYDTTNALRRDIEGFLEGRAVSARHDSLVELVAKFYRRNRVATVASALVLAALGAVLTWSYLNNMRERRTALAQTAIAEMERTRTEAALKQADEHRHRAEDERGKASAAFESEQRQRQQTEILTRLASLALASEQISHDEFAAANSSLESCPAAHRDWVWRRLAWLCQQHLAKFSHDDAVSAVATTSDGRLACSGGADGSVCVDDMRSGKRLAGFKAHASAVRAIAVDDEGTMLVTGGADTTVRVWKLGEEDPAHILFGHDGPIACVAMLPDGRVASAGDDGTVRCWDPAAGAKPVWQAALGEPVKFLARCDDGRLIACGAAGTVVSWDPDGTAHPAIHVDGAAIAATRDGARVCVARPRQGAAVVDLRGGGSIELRIASTDVTGAVFSGDGTRIALSAREGRAWIADAQTGAQTLILRGHAGRINAMGFVGAGTTLITGSDDYSVRLWDTTARRDVSKLDVAGVTAIATNPDGSSLLIAGEDGNATLWDHLGKDKQLTLAQGKAIRAVAFSPDGSCLATAGDGGVCKIWNARTGARLVSILCPPTAIGRVSFNRDGTRIITASGDGRARVWGVADGREQFTCHGHSGAVTGAAFSPDGQIIATVGADGTLRLFKEHNGEQMSVLTGHNTALSAVAFSPDSQRILTSGEQSVDVWDVSDRLAPKQAFTLRGHTGAILDCGFSADGQRMLTASADGTARVWDADSGRGLIVLREHGAAVSCVCQGGTRDVVTAGMDGCVIIWTAVPP